VTDQESPTALQPSLARTGIGLLSRGPQVRVLPGAPFSERIRACRSTHCARFGFFHSTVTAERRRRVGSCGRAVRLRSTLCSRAGRPDRKHARTVPRSRSGVDSDLVGDADRRVTARWRDVPTSHDRRGSTITCMAPSVPAARTGSEPLRLTGRSIGRRCGVTEGLSVLHGRPAHIIQQLVPLLPAPARRLRIITPIGEGADSGVRELDRRAEATGADKVTR
jgi:hypothetical protein